MKVIVNRTTKKAIKYQKTKINNEENSMSVFEKITITSISHQINSHRNKLTNVSIQKIWDLPQSTGYQVDKRARKERSSKVRRFYI